MKRHPEDQNIKIFRATLLNPISDTKCELYGDGALVVKRQKILDYGNAKDILQKYENKGNTTVYLLEDQVIMPSFFDMHFHWVQDDVSLMPKASLLEWLDQYTFPAEAKFQSKKYSKNKAQHFFQKLTQTGTLGGACYSSIHEHALHDAFKYAQGDFIIGNVLMTQNSPKVLTQTPKEALKLTHKLARQYKDRYALTPRFAIATDGDTMRETSKVAKKYKTFMQTHLSETTAEIKFVTSLYKGLPEFKKIKSYTDIYKQVGMLGPRTIMGHGIHLSKDELLQLQKSKTAIAHCPTSNAPTKELGLGSGLFDFKKITKMNIPWALGSDIGGGPFLSMFDVMRSFVMQNNKAKITGATFVKALYRSTLAGAKILKLDKKTGNFAKGKAGNFIVTPKPKGQFKKSEDLLHQIIMPKSKMRKMYNHLPTQVYYQGELVSSK